MMKSDSLFSPFFEFFQYRSYRRNRQNHLFWCTSSVNNFCWIWLVFEEPYSQLLFCFWRICINPWFVTYVDVIHNYWCSFTVLFQHFLALMSTNLFLWAIVRLSGIQPEHFLFGQMFKQYLIDARFTNAKRRLNLTMTHDDLNLSVHTPNRYFR